MCFSEIGPGPVNESPEWDVGLDSGDAGELVASHRVRFHPFLYLADMVVMIVGDNGIVKLAFANWREEVLDIPRINLYRPGVGVWLGRNPVELGRLVFHEFSCIDQHRSSVGKNDERAFSARRIEACMSRYPSCHWGRGDPTTTAEANKEINRYIISW